MKGTMFVGALGTVALGVLSAFALGTGAKPPSSISGWSKLIGIVAAPLAVGTAWAGVRHVVSPPQLLPALKTGVTPETAPVAPAHTGNGGAQLDKALESHLEDPRPAPAGDVYAELDIPSDFGADATGQRRTSAVQILERSNIDIRDGIPVNAQQNLEFDHELDAVAAARALPGDQAVIASTRNPGTFVVGDVRISGSSGRSMGGSIASERMDESVHRFLEDSTEGILGVTVGKYNNGPIPSFLEFDGQELMPKNGYYVAPRAAS